MGWYRGKKINMKVEKDKIRVKPDQFYTEYSCLFR